VRRPQTAEDRLSAQEAVKAMPTKDLEHDDPMNLVGMVLPGDAGQVETMAECIVEEYVRLGWDERRLFSLFASPMFLATHRIYRQKGEGYVRRLIRQTWRKYHPSSTEVSHG